jgi:hypothetical protein
LIKAGGVYFLKISRSIIPPQLSLRAAKVRQLAKDPSSKVPSWTIQAGSVWRNRDLSTDGLGAFDIDPTAALLIADKFSGFVDRFRAQLRFATYSRFRIGVKQFL